MGEALITRRGGGGGVKISSVTTLSSVSKWTDYQLVISVDTSKTYWIIATDEDDRGRTYNYEFIVSGGNKVYANTTSNILNVSNGKITVDVESSSASCVVRRFD